MPEPQKGGGAAKGHSGGSSAAGCLAVNQAALAGNLPVLAFFMGPPHSRSRRPDEKKQPPRPDAPTVEAQVVAEAAAAEALAGEASAAEPRVLETAGSTPEVAAPPRAPMPVPACCSEITPAIESEPHPLAASEQLQPEQPQQQPQQPQQQQLPQQPQEPQSQPQTQEPQPQPQLQPQPQSPSQSQPRPQRRRRLLPADEEQLLRALVGGGQLTSLRWLRTWAMARGRGCRLHEVREGVGGSNE